MSKRQRASMASRRPTGGVGAALAGRSNLEFFIADPEHSVPVVVADEFAARKASAAYIFEATPTNMYSNLDPVNSFLPVGQLFSCMFRSWSRNKVEYLPNPKNGSTAVASPANDAFLTAIYNWVWNQNAGTPNLQFPLAAGTVTRLSPAWASVDGTSNWSPHGPKLYPVHDTQRTGLWCDASAGVSTWAPASIYTFTLPAVLTAGSVNITPYQWDGSQFVPDPAGTAQIPNGQSTITLTVTKNAYRAFEVLVAPASTPANAVASIKVQQKSTADSFAHSPIPGYENMRNAVDEIKVLGNTIRYENTSAALVRGGSIVSLQADADDDWFWDYADGSSNHSLTNNGNGTDCYSTIQNEEDASEGDLVEGYYGFLRPTDDNDIKWQKAGSIDQVGCTLVRGTDLNDIGDFMISMLIPPAAGTQAVPANQKTPYAVASFVRHHHNAINFRSKGLAGWVAEFLPSNNGARPFDAVKDSIRALAFTPQHFTNAFHWSDLAKWIGKGASVAKRFLGLGGAVAPLFGPKGAAIGEALGTGSQIAGLVESMVQ